MIIYIYIHRHTHHTHTVHTYHFFPSRWVSSGCTGGIWNHQRCLGARNEQWSLGALLGWGQPQCCLCGGLFGNAVSWHLLVVGTEGVEKLLGLSEHGGNTKNIVAIEEWEQ